MTPVDTDWIFLICFFVFIFTQWLYFSVDFACVLIIFPLFFSLFTSIHFIFHNCVSTWVFSVIFQFLTFALRTFIMLSFIYLIWRFFFFFFHSLDFQTLSSPSSSDIDASCKMHLHVWSVHTLTLSLPNTIAGPYYSLQFCLL